MRPITSTLVAITLAGLVSGGGLADLHAQSSQSRPAPQPSAAAATPAPPARAKAAASASATSAGQGSIVNLNTATAAELETLPGIGAKTAARIVDYRQKKGQFKKIEELMNVQGIGEKSFLKLKPRITVGGNGQ